MRSQSAVVGMSARLGMNDGKDKLGGGHGREECGGYHLAKETEAMGGFHRRWGFTGGGVRLVT